MICPDCGYNMVPDDSEYGYGCIVCNPPEVTADTHRNEFDELVQKVKRISIQPFTPGQKAGILWAEGEIRRLREAVMDALGSNDDTWIFTELARMAEHRRAKEEE